MLNSSEIGKNIAENLPPQLISSLSTLMTILKAVGIVFLIYIIFLIISALFRLRDSARLKKLARNVQEINDKMNLLVEKVRKTKK